MYTKYNYVYMSTIFILNKKYIFENNFYTSTIEILNFDHLYCESQRFSIKINFFVIIIF